MKFQNPVIFYFPYKSYGGVSDLFFQCFSNLIKNGNESYVCDFIDGDISKRISSNLKNKIIDVENMKLPLKNSIYIFQSMMPWNLRDYESFNDEDKLIYWNLHPYNLYPLITSGRGNLIRRTFSKIVNVFSYYRLKKIKKFTEMMIQKESLYFMDYENKMKTEQMLGINISDKYILPLFLEEKASTIKKINSKKISKIGYLGRLVDFKVYPLLQILNRLENLKRNYEFYIIGDGPMEEYLRSLSYQYLKIKFINYIDLNKDDSVIYEVDLFFAMGLSMMEIASRGIPVIPMDYSYKKMNRLIKLKSLSDIHSFNLAEELVNENQFESKCSLGLKIDKIEKNYLEYSHMSKEWVSKNYSLNNWMENFQKAIKSSKVKFKDIKNNGFHKPDLISLIFKSTVMLFKNNKLSYFKSL